jgi:hypothetical protein
MIVFFTHLQQEIADASNDAARMYYEDTAEADRTVSGVTAMMRASNNPSRASSQSSQQLQIPSLVMSSSKRSVFFVFIICIFLSHLLWRLDHRIHPLLQITKHWSNYEKLEISLERLRLIATAVAAPPHKVRWLSNWTSSSSTREAFHFLAKGFLDKDLEAWLNKATFWTGVSDQCS